MCHPVIYAWAGAKDKPVIERCTFSSRNIATSAARIHCLSMMPGRRWFAIILWFALAAPLKWAQGTPPAVLPGADLIKRYRQMLERNPVEGVVLDRLWEATGPDRSALLLEYHDRAVKGDAAAALIYAHLLKKSGSLPTALKAYEAATQLNPQDPNPHLSLAKLHFQMGNPRQAAAAYEQALTLLAPRDARIQSTLLSLGETWLAAGDATKAAEAWERAMGTDPGNLDLRIRLAALAEKNGLLDRAIEHHTEVARAGSASQRATASLELARLFERRGEPQNAIDVLERGLAVTAADNWLYEKLLSRLIEIHKTNGSLAKLEKDWVAQARRNANDPAVLSRVVAYYTAVGNPEQELFWLEKMMELQPRETSLLRRAARAAAAAGNDARALSLGQKLIELEPGNLDAVFFVAERELRRGNTDAAARVVGALLDARPSDENLTQAATFFIRNRLWAAAEDALQRAAKKSPRNPEAARALAEFYFDRNRAADGVRAAEGMVDLAAEPRVQSQQLHAAAELLEGRGHARDAAKLLERAVTLEPGPETRARYATALAALGKRNDAVAQLRAALAQPLDPETRAQLDRALYAQLVSTSAEIRAEAINIPGLGDVPLESTQSRDAKRLLLHPAAAAELKTRREKAAAALAGSSPDAEDAVLALARWEALCRLPAEAISSVRKLNPPSRRALEFIAQTAAESSLHKEAIDALEKLALGATPEEAAGYRRRIARHLLDSGLAEEALAAYRNLVAAEPDSPRALSDLADALQRLDRWQDALEIWQQAFANSRPGDRETLLKSYVRALTQVGRPADALALMDAELAFVRDIGRRERLFQEAWEYARRNQLEDGYRRTWEERVATDATNNFARRSLAWILQRVGEERAAYNLVTLPSAGKESEDDLRARARAAADFGDFKTAIEAQEKLVSLSGATEDRMELAAYQEAWFDVAGAQATWDAAVQDEPRNVDALLGAAAFYSSLGDKQRQIELLRRAVEIDPHLPAAQNQLGKLLLDRGDIPAAVSAFEAVLSSTKNVEGDFEPPVTPAVGVLSRLPAIIAASQPGVVPAEPELGSALRTLARQRAGAATASDMRALRLAAIATLARLASESEQSRTAWIERWKNHPQTIEAVHALHFCGADAETHAALAKHAAAVTSATHERRLPLVWSALARQDFARLAEALRELKEPVRSQYVILALGHEALAHGHIPSGLTDALLPVGNGNRELLWQTALLLEGCGQLDAAVNIARRALGEEIEKRDEALALAQWEAARGNVDGAKVLLDRMARTTSGRPLSSSAYVALRARILLEQTAEERRAVAEEFMAETRASRDPAHAAQVQLLVSAIFNDNRGVSSAARDLIAAQPFAAGVGNSSGGVTSFSGILSAALTLREMNYPDAAIALLRASLEDEARLTLLDESARLEAEQARLLLSALETVSIVDARGMKEFPAFHGSRGRDWLQALATQLEAMQRPAAAGAIFSVLLAAEPQDEYFFRSSILDLAKGGELEAAKELFTTTIASGQGQAPEAAIAQVATDLAGVLREKKDFEGAGLVLDRAIKKQPSDAPLRMTFAEHALFCGELERAVDLLADIIRGQPGDWPARVSLARAYRQLDRFEDALKALGFDASLGFLPPDKLPVEAAAEVARIRTLRGEALLVAEARKTLIRDGSADVLADAARSIAAAGQTQDALALARLCATTVPAAQSRPHFEALLQLIAAQPGLPGGLLAHWMNRAREVLTADTSAPDAAFIGMIKDLALRNPAREEPREFLTVLAERGQLLYWSGNVITALSALKDAPRLERIVRALASAGVQPPENLREAVAALHAVGRQDDAVTLASRLLGMRPTDLVNVLTYALALHRARKPEEAAAAVAKARLFAAFDVTALGRIGLCLLDMDKPNEAFETLQAAAEADPLNRSSWIREALLREHVRTKNRAAADHILKRHRTPRLLAEYAVAFGELPNLRNLWKSFGLDDAHRTAIHLAVCTTLLGEEKSEALLDFLANYPGILTVPGAPLSEIVRATKPDQLATLAGIMEQALAQKTVVALKSSLADVYRALAKHQPPSQAHGWLARAEALQPQSFSAAKERAEALRAAGSVGEAITALESFIARSQSPARTVQAKKMLEEFRETGPR